MDSAEDLQQQMAPDFHCRDLGPGTYLLTYALRQDQRLTRRATV